ncbi:hypothetical protein MHUMG1_06835 [Metarhizium humberi]|uniref:Uncharacterized protein n=1 Tax=Metarhizium humberi TaxID=2596975 RepID=A0A9P8M8B9_9HYPO|nr:hypothetical protein MHUMG1_06835 [Metarhizium humberi]
MYFQQGQGHDEDGQPEEKTYSDKPRAVLRHLCLGKQCAATEALDTTVTARMKHSDGKIGDDFDGWAGACAEDVAKERLLIVGRVPIAKQKSSNGSF